MTKVEMMINELENNNKVIGNVKFADGTIESIEMVEDLEQVVAVEVIELQAYEENDYDVEGLVGQWVEVK